MTRDKSKFRATQRKYQQKLREELIEAYGNKCSLCSFANPLALELDHINGGGSKERQKISQRGLALKLKKANYPKDTFRLLCANCHRIETYNKRQYNLPRHFACPPSHTEKEDAGLSNQHL